MSHHGHYFLCYNVCVYILNIKNVISVNLVSFLWDQNAATTIVVMV